MLYPSRFNPSAPISHATFNAVLTDLAGHLGIGRVPDNTLGYFLSNPEETGMPQTSYMVAVPHWNSIEDVTRISHRWMGEGAGDLVWERTC